MEDKIRKKLEEWVLKNYNQSATGWTSERSFGNCDDCFEDGYQCGESWAAYTIGMILGMELDAPKHV